MKYLNYVYTKDQFEITKYDRKHDNLSHHVSNSVYLPITE